MTNEEFDRLVNGIQKKYGSRPFVLRTRIAVLVVLGYSIFLALLLIVMVLAIGLMIGAFVADREPGIFLMALFALLLAFGLCQALVFLWVPLEPLKARTVSRTEAPRLFDLLDTLQNDLKATQFHRIYVTSDFNASVQTIPQLGVLGFNRSYLYLGLPLLRAISPDQFSAVLAHEVAHCSSRHDRFGMWIYRLRETWSRVFAELHDTQSGGIIKSFRGVILRFVDWYWPRFNAHAFVLSRANEYEADRVAAERVGTWPTADALFRIECLGTRINDKFWEQLTQSAKDECSVPDDFMQRIQTFLVSTPDPSDAKRWMETCSQMLTGNIDTHPSLSDRLKSLGLNVNQFVNNGFPAIPSTSAAEVFLGESLQTLTRDVNRDWRNDNELRWQSVFHQARRLEKQYASILSPIKEIASNASPMSENSDFVVDHLWQQAKAIGEMQGAAAAEPILRQLIAQAPSHSLAIVTLGGHLIERNDSEGEQMLLRILEEEDNELTPIACQKLIVYYQQLGQSEKVQRILAYMSRFAVAQAAAANERSLVTASDDFLTHELSQIEMQTLKLLFAEQTELESAWLVRKNLQYFPDKRLFVLVVRTRPGLFGGSNPDRDHALVTRLIANVKLPGRILIVAPQGAFRKLAKKVMSQINAQVFPQ